MVDRDRILAKLDELEGSLNELRQIAPATFEAYQAIEKRRACERLLQISIESLVDICNLFVSGLRLGLPSEENDLFEKLERAGVISTKMRETLQRLKAFRNLLVHEYGRINDRLVFEFLQIRLGDFENFRREILKALEREFPQPT